MINTFRFNNEIQVPTEDGNTRTVTIPAPVYLNAVGAHITVNVTHPQSTAELFQREGREVPVVSAIALIDTGASFSIINPNIADRLGLVHTGYQRVTSVQDEQLRPVYYGTIRFSWEVVNQYLWFVVHSVPMNA